ncbi:MAG: hypothetical protein ABI772_12795 [Bacteroidota bacterium]
MKLKHIALLIMAVVINTASYAQKSAVKKVAPKKTLKCHVAADTATVKLTLAQAQAWADSLPLNVICDDLKSYKLHNFNFTLLLSNPFQSKEFGTGNGGIPFLARKAINNLKPKDAVILKDATYLDEKGVEQKLPIISFSIVE